MPVSSESYRKWGQPHSQIEVRVFINVYLACTIAVLRLGNFLSHGVGHLVQKMEFCVAGIHSSPLPASISRN